MTWLREGIVIVVGLALGFLFAQSFRSRHRSDVASKSWVREAISDENKQADIAYVSIGALTLSAIFSLAFIFTMSAISYANCAPITTMTEEGKGVMSVVPCNFDPLPVGQAVGLIFVAYASLIGSLVAYMVATRRRGPRGESVTELDQAVK